MVHCGTLWWMTYKFFLMDDTGIVIFVKMDIVETQ